MKNKEIYEYTNPFSMLEKMKNIDYSVSLRSTTFLCSDYLMQTLKDRDYVEVAYEKHGSLTQKYNYNL